MTIIDIVIPMLTLSLLNLLYGILERSTDITALSFGNTIGGLILLALALIFGW